MSDEAGGKKGPYDTQWSKLLPNTINDLHDNDEIAVLYCQPEKDIPITFTFHEQ